MHVASRLDCIQYKKVDDPFIVIHIIVYIKLQVF